ncbi:hypothetical protein [Agromyces sp. C10]|uniref:hypothetical protein n=1 Tax=Agromyces sp. C10 TaxID=2935077 RepID=UPI00200B2193|nr:hypothetical protein [Agromyces sp. C10]MCK8609775.1 hypothetical protein [Agromyces sp. C10]
MSGDGRAVDGSDGMGGTDGTEGTGTSTGSTGSYGRPGSASPDPKQPVMSMDTAAADGDAEEHDDPAAHGGPELRELPTTEDGVVADDASKDHGVGGRA